LHKKSCWLRINLGYEMYLKCNVSLVFYKTADYADLQMTKSRKSWFYLSMTQSAHRRVAGSVMLLFSLAAERCEGFGSDPCSGNTRAVARLARRTLNNSASMFSED
jgi:hypothetical protein